MHALHNAALIRETLPRHLAAPKPYLADRLGKHNELAAELRVSGPTKRAETAAKTKATKAKKKQDREGETHRAAGDRQAGFAEGAPETAMEE